MLGKAIIYQVLPRLWNTSHREAPLKVGGSLAENGAGHFSAFDQAVLSYLHDQLHVSHVWYTGVIRHAGGENSWVKGQAGSPYTIEDYFDVNPYLADKQENRIDEFKSLIKRTHEAGMKVIIDFIPNHLARTCSSFFGSGDDVSVHWKPENDFFYYPGQELKLPIETTYREYPAKASGNAFTPTPGEYDWYDTVKLNYCDFHTLTWDKMLQVLCFWKELGVDGFRCDMVELVPRPAIAWLIQQTKEKYPDTAFIAEVYDKDGYRWYADAGFDALYDKCGLYDVLFDIIRNNGSTESITRNWQFLGDLQPSMLNFLENHDEVRLASDFFAGSATAGLAALYVILLFNTSPFMLYFGQEIGERGMDAEGFSSVNGRTTIFDWWCPASILDLDAYIHGTAKLPKAEATLLKRYSRLLEYASTDIIQKGVTYDLRYCNLDSPGFDSRRHFAFLRCYKGKLHLIAVNFSDQDADIELRIPAHTFTWANIPTPQSDTTLRISIPAHDGIIIKKFPHSKTHGHPRPCKREGPSRQAGRGRSEAETVLE